MVCLISFKIILTVTGKQIGGNGGVLEEESGEGEARIYVLAVWLERSGQMGAMFRRYESWLANELHIGHKGMRNQR